MITRILYHPIYPSHLATSPASTPGQRVFIPPCRMLLTRQRSQFYKYLVYALGIHFHHSMSITFTRLFARLRWSQGTSQLNRSVPPTEEAALLLPRATVMVAFPTPQTVSSRTSTFRATWGTPVSESALGSLTVRFEGEGARLVFHRVIIFPALSCRLTNGL